MKIGILTHYYGSFNYGGVLQSYALVKVLKKLGYEAEQICFPCDDCRTLDSNCVKTTGQVLNVLPSKSCHAKKNHYLFIYIFSKIKRVVGSKIIGYLRKKKETQRVKHISQDYFSSRAIAFDSFRNKIPHSKQYYTLNTLFLSNEEYDVFITGSDQVWNLRWHNHGFFLEFVDDDKKKIAYAASAGTSSFDEVQRKYLRRVLPRFYNVSVREKDLVATYKKIADIKAEYVLDPTLLLNSKDWDEISSPRLIDEKYLFCFFYSPTERVYHLVTQYAQKHNYKIAIIPYACFSTEIKLDDDYGDFRIGNASPEDFLSLIKNAECVLTDSFHCNVFSIIYNRPFFSFGRNESSEMNSRIISLTEMFNCSDRFCENEEKQVIDYLDSVHSQDYAISLFHNMQENSIDFLEHCLKE